MNRVVFKESDMHHLLIDIVLYSLIVLIGFIILFSRCLLNTIYPIFYSIAILSLTAYYANKNKNNYELLMFSLINIFVGTFTLLNHNFFSDNILISLCIFIYTVCNVANKWYYTYMIEENTNSYAIFKSSITILLLILGIVVTINSATNASIKHEFIGYYFIAFGILSLLEPLIKLFIRNNTINNYLCKEGLKEKKEVVKVTKKEKIKPEIKKVVKRRSVKTTKKNNVKEK